MSEEIDIKFREFNKASNIASLSYILTVCMIPKEKYSLRGRLIDSIFHLNVYSSKSTVRFNLLFN